MSDCCLTSSINTFSAISRREHVTFQIDEDYALFALDQHAYFDFFYSDSSLRQQTLGIHVAPLGYIILIPRSQLLFNAVYLAEKPQMQFV